MLPRDLTIRTSPGISSSHINPDNTTTSPHRHSHIHHASNTHQLNPPTRTHSSSSFILPSTPTQDSDTSSYHPYPISDLPNIRTPIPLLDTCNTPTPHISPILLSTEISHTSNAIPCLPLPLPFPGNERGSHYTTPKNYNKHPTPSHTALP